MSKKELSGYVLLALSVPFLIWFFMGLAEKDIEKYSIERENLELSIKIKRKMLADSTYYNECVNLLKLN